MSKVMNLVISFLLQDDCLELLWLKYSLLLLLSLLVNKLELIGQENERGQSLLLSQQSIFHIPKILIHKLILRFLQPLKKKHLLYTLQDILCDTLKDSCCGWLYELPSVKDYGLTHSYGKGLELTPRRKQRGISGLILSWFGSIGQDLCFWLWGFWGSRYA